MLANVREPPSPPLNHTLFLQRGGGEIFFICFRVKHERIFIATFSYSVSSFSFFLLGSTKEELEFNLTVSRLKLCLSALIANFNTGLIAPLSQISLCGVTHLKWT